MKFTFELDTDRDLTPEEARLLQANALINGRTVPEQLRVIFLGDPPPRPSAELANLLEKAPSPRAA